MRYTSFIWSIFLIAVLFAVSCPLIAGSVAAHAADSAGIIYIVFAIDTEPARIPPWEKHPVLDFFPFHASGDKARVAAVMDENWRESYRDSFGGLPRFTWFVLSHEALFHARGGYGSIVYDSLMIFADAIEKYGDEIGWHYHHAEWTDPNRDGRHFWNQLTTFDGTAYIDGSDVEIAERSLNALLFERRFFPTVFRSGWTWENNELSAWLENIIPYDFSAYPLNTGNKSKREPLRNVYDWSRAPTAYRGYHPNRFDYQKSGVMHRWIFRTIGPNTEHEWGRLIVGAAAGEDQIFCFSAHSYDNIRKDIDGFLGRYLRMADSLGIKTRFATASRAAAAIAGISDTTPPRISMNISDSGVVIQTEKRIFQSLPYCVAVDSTSRLARLVPAADGPNRWRIFKVPDRCREIVCAVSGFSGKSAISSITIKSNIDTKAYFRQNSWQPFRPRGRRKTK